MHALLINPNTRTELTRQLVARLAPTLAGLGCELVGETAPFGADYISSERSHAVAAHAVLAAWDAHLAQHGPPRAVLVACFGDPGVWALREVAGVPVTGLAEAAMREAEAVGPFAIVTGGHAWGPMLERLAWALGLHAPACPRGLLAVHTVEMPGDALLADPERGARLLGEACGAAQRNADGAASAPRALILGGAALAGWAPRLQPPAAIPVIDSVDAGGRWLRQHAAAPASASCL